MDACFSLLLPPTVRLEGLDRFQRSITWGGAIYPQYPVIWRWGEHVHLVQSPTPQHYFRFLSESHRSINWTCCPVLGEGLDLLESEVNGHDFDWHGKSLEDLLRLLLSRSSAWAVVFELHSDQIDSIHGGTVDQCVDKLKCNLLSETQREGFVFLSS